MSIFIIINVIYNLVYTVCCPLVIRNSNFNGLPAVMALIELKDEKIKQRGFRIILGGLSGRRGLSEPISEPLDSESCIHSRATVENGNCLRLCSLLISSRIFCDILVGDIVDTPASANGLN
uniref:Uncharacterized protein n=1 Tax=Glossina palpalis gambiensis TaxID=67801 RepID=A0A1B0BQ84_9MUSC